MEKNRRIRRLKILEQGAIKVASIFPNAVLVYKDEDYIFPFLDCEIDFYTGNENCEMVIRNKELGGRVVERLTIDNLFSGFTDSEKARITSLPIIEKKFMLLRLFSVSLNDIMGEKRDQNFDFYTMNCVSEYLCENLKRLIDKLM